MVYMNTIYGEIPRDLWVDLENKNNGIKLDDMPRIFNAENERITTEDLNKLKLSIEASTKVSEIADRNKNMKLNLDGIEEPDRNFISRIKERYKDNSSIDWELLNNKDVQELLWSIFSDVSKNLKGKMNRKKERINSIQNRIEIKANEEKDIPIESEGHITEKKVENNETVETFEEYRLHEETPENFEKFIMSQEWLRIINAEINRAKIQGDGKLSVNNEKLSFYLKVAWKRSLENEYKEKYKKADQNLEDVTNKWLSTASEINNTINSFVSWELNENELVWKLDAIINGNNVKNIFENTDLKNQIRNTIRESIIDCYQSMKIVDKYNRISIKSWNEEMDASIQSYLYIYWKFFFSDVFPKKCWSLTECQWDLKQIMEAILLTDEIIKYNPKKHSKNKYYKKEKEIEKKSIEESIKKKEELKKRMQELNAKNSYNNSSSREWRLWIDNDWKSLDVNKASWLEIASSLNLWKKLSNYKVSGNESIDENIEHEVKRKAFQQSFRAFLETSYKEGQQMKSVIDESQMRKIYNFENNSINTSEFEIYKNRLLKQWFDNDDINQIYWNLNRFLGMMNEAISKVWDEAMNKQWKFWERVKTHAVWAIIDNIKAIFSQSWNDKLWSIFEWFQFDNNSPVDIIWNNMLIHGKMNWVNIAINYKLDNWEIYINSFIQKKIVPSKITIWNMEPDYKIWQIDSFDKILDNYYKLPTISGSWSETNYKVNKKQRAKMVNDNRLKFQELFGTKLDVIWEMAKYHIEKQGVRNSVIKTFCNTFHMNQEKLEVTEWSNLYDTLDIISNSDTDTLASFSKNMEIFLNYFWLKWWDENNILDEKKSIIFDEDSRVDEWIKDIQGGMMNKIKESMKNFNNEKNKITYNNTWNFDNTYNIWLAWIIKEYMKEWSKPGWKLDITKMEQFLKKFNIWLSELNQKKNELSDLDEKFDEA